MTDDEIKELEAKLVEAKRLRSLISSYEVALRVLCQEDNIRSLVLECHHGSSAVAKYDLMLEDRDLFVAIFKRRLVATQAKLDGL